MASVAAHPLARLHRAGVSVTLSTDDTTVSDVTLSEEYARAVEENGLSLKELFAIDRRALAVAFGELDRPSFRPAPSSTRGGASRAPSWGRRLTGDVPGPPGGG